MERRWIAAVLALALAPASAALAANPAFPGSNPDESVRVHTPDDPDFDRCEPALPGEGQQTCENVFDQQYQRFGFAPASTQDTATYHNPTDPHVQRLMAQNTAAGRHPLGQVPGVSADRAWKSTAGDPRVRIGIIDTGIVWSRSSLRRQIALNSRELPLPQGCTSYDCNGDGSFNVDDYAGDARVSTTAGAHGDPARVDAEDLIATFSDGTDADGNGYVDDIAGWDFFDDDNNAYDASSYGAAHNHGSGRAEDAAEAGNDADGGLGLCPRCQILPLRAWDSFVLDTNNFGEAVAYAADNGAKVAEGAVGGLYNTAFDREAFDYAYRKGLFLAIVSSDANTADHNVPTVYDEALMVQGTVADVQGLGYSGSSWPQQFIDFFGMQNLALPANLPVGTWFRNSGETQYGGHAHIAMPATSGSEGTGQAAGAAGLLASYGIKRSEADPDFGPPLRPNEIKQLLTMTAQDVVPENTAGTGVPDPAQVGWDQHFGYGLPDLGLAMERIRQHEVPPQALIKSPAWFAPLDVDKRSSVEVAGRVSAIRAEHFSWKLQWAPGLEPCESDFHDVNVGDSSTPVDGTLGQIDLAAVRAALDARHATSVCGQPPAPVSGGAAFDPTAPVKGPGDVDPNEPAFTVRVVVTDDGGNRGEDRKTLFVYRDPTLKDGWPDHPDAGGEQSQRLWDLDGDNKLDIVQADSSGTLRVLRADGSPLPSFNHGQPVHTLPYANVHSGAPVFGSLTAPREVLRTPVIGDIDGDLEPEIVDSAGEHVYAWNPDGTPVPGFPVRLDPALSRPADRSEQNHVKRGFQASPTLADLDGDGSLEIAVPAMDQHLYAWHGDGTPLAGFPLLLKKPGETNAAVPGAEATTSAAAGDLNGDGKAELVMATNELQTTAGLGIPGGPGLSPGEGRIYAIDGHGKLLPGWPATPTGQLPGLIPFFGPAVENALADLDGDGKLDVVGGLTSDDARGYGADGQDKVDYMIEQPGGETANRTLMINTFEYPTVADLNGDGTPEVMKGGVSIEGVANLLLVGQNIPFNHVMQAWDGASGRPLPGWPQAVEDWQWLSNPAVADVSDAPGVEILAPTGLYLIRNLNAQGIEGAGWPKFTGGWNMATPAVGDADGDGKLEVAAITREGNAFLWDTDQPACGGNDQWWTSRHDERGTGNREVDSRPPNAPESLSAARDASGISLTWKAPGDDWACGKAKSFRVLTSRRPIEHPSDGEVVADYDATKTAGDVESVQIADPHGRFFAAVMYRDDAGNWGHLTQVELPDGSPAATSVPAASVPAGSVPAGSVPATTASPDAAAPASPGAVLGQRTASAKTKAALGRQAAKRRAARRRAAAKRRAAKRRAARRRAHRRAHSHR